MINIATVAYIVQMNLGDKLSLPMVLMKPVRNLYVGDNKTQQPATNKAKNRRCFSINLSIM